MAKLSVVWIGNRATEAIEITRVAQEAGFWGVGICDSPVLYQELYPVISACLMQSSTIRVGTNVTNPVSRHWTIHASSARTFEELYPGRFYLGISTGDGAVRGVGIPPAKISDLENAVAEIARAGPPNLPIQMGVAGPRGAEAAGRVADGIIIGTGADAVAIEALRSRALAAHSRAQRTTPFEVWGEVSLNVVERAADITAAREQMLGHAVGHSRHSFSWTFEDKNVPVEFQSDMRELYPQYQFSHHASRDGNLNASLFANHPRLRDYIIDRFSIIGTPQQCKERLIQFIEEGRLDGVYLPINLPNAVQVVRRAADAFGDLLNT